MAQTCGIDPEELRVREGEHPANEHPLETAWTFWFDKKTSDRKESDQYMEGLRQLGSFNTVEGFYRHYTHLLRPSELPRDHNCYMFRKNYKPMWEEFPEGGCWIIRIKRKASQNYVNHMWENLLLACIGEAFEMPDVVGCVLSTRIKDDVLSIWNLTNRDTPARFRIGERLKEVLDLNMTALIQYKDHMQSLQDYSTYRNARNYMFAPSPNMTPMQHVLDTPLYGAIGTPDHGFSEAEHLLPPGMMDDDLLPPAAVDSEGFGGGWPASGLVGGSVAERSSSGLLSGKSPGLVPQAPPNITKTKSPALSASAPPWTGGMGLSSSSVGAAEPSPTSVAATASSTPPLASETPKETTPAPGFSGGNPGGIGISPELSNGAPLLAGAPKAWPAASAAAKAAIPAAAPTVPASGPTTVASPPTGAVAATAPTIVAQAAAAAAAAAATSPTMPASTSAMTQQVTQPVPAVAKPAATAPVQTVVAAAPAAAVAKSPIPSPKFSISSGSPIPSPKTSVVVRQPGGMVATSSNTVVVASPPKAVVGTPPLQPTGAPVTVSAPITWAAKMAAQQNRGPPAKAVPKVVVVTPAFKMAATKSFGKPGAPFARPAMQAPTAPKPKGV
mmetsp:Transcript_41510/g.89146  ORF Transcript_41510/g.89146 Transcript_41510/m.89146 type:complete len:614 (-) Transcript_41510:234-2075(-)